MRLRVLFCTVFVLLLAGCLRDDGGPAPATTSAVDLPPPEAAPAPEASSEAAPASEAPGEKSTPPTPAVVCKKIQVMAAAEDKTLGDVGLCLALMDGYMKGDEESGKALFNCVLGVSSIKEMQSQCAGDDLVSALSL